MPEKEIFDFDKILRSPDDYHKAKKDLKEKVLSDFMARRNPAEIMISGEKVTCDNGFVLVNLLLLGPYVDCGVPVTRKMLFSDPAFTEDTLYSYMDITQKACRDAGAPNEKVADSVKNALDEMSDLAGKLNVLAGNSLSYWDFINLMENDPEARKLFDTKLYEKGKKKALQYSEIEKKFKDTGKELISYYKKHPETEMYPFIMANTGVNPKQFTQFAGFVGLKPDMDGTVIPVAIEDNYLRGLTNLEAYYINCKGTRKALTTNAKMVSEIASFIKRFMIQNILICWKTLRALRAKVRKTQRLGNQQAGI
jgi:hypothetical protein